MSRTARPHWTPTRRPAHPGALDGMWVSARMNFTYFSILPEIRDTCKYLRDRTPSPHDLVPTNHRLPRSRLRHDAVPAPRRRRAACVPALTPPVGHWPVRDTLTGAAAPARGGGSESERENEEKAGDFTERGLLLFTVRRRALLEPLPLRNDVHRHLTSAAPARQSQPHTRHHQSRCHRTLRHADLRRDTQHWLSE